MPCDACACDACACCVYDASEWMYVHESRKLVCHVNTHQEMLLCACASVSLLHVAHVVALCRVDVMHGTACVVVCATRCWCCTLPRGCDRSIQHTLHLQTHTHTHTHTHITHPHHSFMLHTPPDLQKVRTHITRMRIHIREGAMTQVC